MADVARSRLHALPLAAIYVGADVNNFLAVSAKEASGTDAGVGVAAHVVTRGAIFAFVSKTSRSFLTFEAAEIGWTFAKVVDRVPRW